MNNLLQNLWQLNIEFSLLLLATLLVRFGLRRTVKNHNAYLLWLSLPAALILAPILSTIKLSPPPVASLSQVINSDIVQSYVLSAPPQNSEWFAVALLWTAVSVCLLIRLFLQHRQLRSELTTIERVKNPGIRSNFPIKVVNKADFSPAVYGFVRPTIYFPIQLVEELSAQQVTLIIQHEEHHIKQGHLWLNLLWDMLVCLLWFNPFVYLSRQRFRHDQELFCDYLVLHRADKQQQQSYGHALLSTVSATHSVSLLCSWKSFNQLEERIMNIKNPASFSGKILLSICCLAIIGGTSLYSVSAHEPSEKNKVVKIVKKTSDQDSAQNNEIKLILDGQTYHDINGERYIVEDGSKRAMTEQEAMLFTEELATLKGQMMNTEEMQNKQVHIIKQMGDEGLSEQQMMIMGEEMQHVEFELERQGSDFDRIEHELERALKEIEGARAADQMSEKAMKKAQKQLQTTRSTLQKDREKMRIQLEKAQQEIQKVRSALHAKRDESAQ